MYGLTKTGDLPAGITEITADVGLTHLIVAIPGTVVAGSIPIVVISGLRVAGEDTGNSITFIKASCTFYMQIIRY